MHCCCSIDGQLMVAQPSSACIMACALPASSIGLTMKSLPECMQWANVTPTVSCNTDSESMIASIEEHTFFIFMFSLTFCLVCKVTKINLNANESITFFC